MRFLPSLPVVLVLASAILLLSCTRASSPTPPPPPLPSASSLASVSAAPPLLPPQPPTPPAFGSTPLTQPTSSCPPLRPVESAEGLDPRIDIGWANGMTWLFGYDNFGARLIHLNASGGLAKTVVPLNNAQAAAVSLGDSSRKIYFYAPSEGPPPAPQARWNVIDISKPDAPSAGPVEDLSFPLGAPKLSHASSFAVGSKLSLLLVGGVMKDAEIVLIDTATRAAAAPPIPIEDEFKPTHAWCYVDRCAVVGIAHEGGGPKRRVAVIRVAPNGTVDREELSPDWVGNVYVAHNGVARGAASADPNTFTVMWSGHDGVNARWLDLWGYPKGPVVDAKWDKSKYINHQALISGPGVAFMMVGERGKWSSASLGPGQTISAFKEIVGADRYFLIGASLDDGLAWASHGSNVDYSERGKGSGVMTHSWNAGVEAGFVANSSSSPSPTAAKRIDVANSGGPGRGGLEPYLLARPGMASVLVIARGDAATFGGKSQLTAIRSKCPSGK